MTEATQSAGPMPADTPHESINEHDTGKSKGKTKRAKRPKRTRHIFRKILAALLALLLVLMIFNLTSNRFGASYDDLGPTERTILDEYGKLYSAVEKDHQSLWADDPLTKRPIAAIGGPGSYDTLLINPTNKPNPLTSVRIEMPENSPLTVYRVASADPDVFTKTYGIGDYGLGSLSGNDLYYVRLTNRSVGTDSPYNRVIYMLTHESMHTYMQGNWPRGDQFANGLRDQDMDQVYRQIEELTIMQQQIESGNPDNQALREALSGFVEASDALKKTSPEYAQLSETKYTDEGTAEYVGYRAEELVGDYQPHILLNATEPVLFSRVANGLKNGALNKDFLMQRIYPYAVGLQLCLVFDQLGVQEWQQKLNSQTLDNPLTVVDIARDVVNNH